MAWRYTEQCIHEVMRAKRAAGGHGSGPRCLRAIGGETTKTSPVPSSHCHPTPVNMREFSHASFVGRSSCANLREAIVCCAGSGPGRGAVSSVADYSASLALPHQGIPGADGGDCYSVAIACNRFYATNSRIPTDLGWTRYLFTFACAPIYVL